MRNLLWFSILVALLSACGTSPTNTAVPTNVPPTATETLPASPTWTPRPISLQACVTDSTIRIRKGPGTEYEVIGGLVSGTCMSLSGRNQDSTWVHMTTRDKTGWVAAQLLTIDGDLSRLSVQSASEALSLAPTAEIAPTATSQFSVEQGLNNTSTNTPPSALHAFSPVPLCSDTAARIGEQVSCRIERAYCDYKPLVNGSPTFCDDRPYPNQDFQLVVFGEDWSDYDGRCIIVSGVISRYEGVLQIQAASRSQVSYCE